MPPPFRDKNVASFAQAVLKFFYNGTPTAILSRISVQRETQVGARPSSRFASPSLSNECSGSMETP